MRALAAEVGAVEGDLLKLTFNAVDGTCTAVRVDKGALAGLPVPEAIEALTGVKNTTDNLRARLARAMGVDVTGLLPTLQRRGESTLLELLPGEEPDAALKEALAGLADLFDSR